MIKTSDEKRHEKRTVILFNHGLSEAYPCWPISEHSFRTKTLVPHSSLSHLSNMTNKYTTASLLDLLCPKFWTRRRPSGGDVQDNFFFLLVFGGFGTRNSLTRHEFPRKFISKSVKILPSVSIEVGLPSCAKENDNGVPGTPSYKR